MSIHVIDFKWEPGKNDVKYIELLEKTLKNEQTVTGKAVAKVRQLAKENEEFRNKTIDEFAEALKDRYESHSIDFILNDNNVASSSDSYFIFESYIDEIADQMKHRKGD